MRFKREVFKFVLTDCIEMMGSANLIVDTKQNGGKTRLSSWARKVCSTVFKTAAVITQRKYGRKSVLQTVWAATRAKKKAKISNKR